MEEPNGMKMLKSFSLLTYKLPILSFFRLENFTNQTKWITFVVHF